MSVVKINAIHVPENAGPELERRFAARKHTVDGAPGFEGFQLLRPVQGESRYFVVTTWASEEAFQAWAENGAKAAHAPAAAHSSEAHDGAHESADGGHPHNADTSDGAAAADRRPVATGADLLEFEVVDL
ncbi:antibiotic biosynthesis monooxygenase family protein [Curtobacterium ammoniigenes]|uniref:antibiotic biosynthesis monooxygenase family protein n=1 Tax=Curtobacterium ammoniigenes TaxID=395387 RepID=UPI00082AB2EE|nr:antibiotic biosynthesis monooxygenase [Curtobacterium ammoniigenes]